MNRKMRFALAVAAMAGGVLGLGIAERVALAQVATKASQAQETSVEGVTAEVTEAVRKEGVLTIKVRYRNTGGAPAKVNIWGGSTTYYVTAGSTKYLILSDSQGVALAVPRDIHGNLTAEIKPGGSFLFWAKYPAPPAEAKKLSFYGPHAPPFEDIAITEAK